MCFVSFVYLFFFFFVFKQKTAYELRISDWSSDVCSSDLLTATPLQLAIMTARIVNRGRAVRPGLVRQAAQESEAGAQEQIPSLGIASRWLDLMREAMVRVVNSPQGTAYSARIAETDRAMGGKTGTSQARRIPPAARRAGTRKTEDGPWVGRAHPLFVGWAPPTTPPLS